MKEKYFADDRVIIPEFIEKMTDDELDEFIRKKEEEARQEKLKRNQKLAATV